VRPYEILSLIFTVNRIMRHILAFRDSPLYFNIALHSLPPSTRTIECLYSPVLDTAIAARSSARSKADTCVFNITKELMLHPFHLPDTLTKTEARITHSVQQYATRRRTDDRFCISSKSKGFFSLPKRPDRLWGPDIHLIRTRGSVSRGKVAEG
jgi:hypothetical protein